MFDLRYHVASLAAVFVALLIGILVGVAMSGKVDDAEKKQLQKQRDALQSQLEAAGERRANAVREQKATQAFVKNAYPALISERLSDTRVAIIFVGPVDTGTRKDVERALADAGATGPVRLRALKVPIDVADVDGALSGDLRSYRGDGELDDLGRKLADEFVSGGDTPAWDALTSLLVEEKAGSFRRTVDGIVVVRTVKPQEGETLRFLVGLYQGLAGNGVPAVGVERSSTDQSAVGTWSDAGLSTVDDLDKPAGRLALALLLSGSSTGNYGVKPSATDGLVPPIEPLPTQTGG
jgi:Copper transport outer membrane protein, MctB